MRRPNTPESFWANVDKSGECWVWTRSLNRHGYGQASMDSRKMEAHRLAYLLAVGPVPEGFQLDHLCRVKHCVNPGHLEPVTRSENARRGWAAQKAADPGYKRK